MRTDAELPVVRFAGDAGTAGRGVGKEDREALFRGGSEEAAFLCPVCVRFG